MFKFKWDDFNWFEHDGRFSTWDKKFCQIVGKGGLAFDKHKHKPLMLRSTSIELWKKSEIQKRDAWRCLIFLNDFEVNDFQDPSMFPMFIHLLISNENSSPVRMGPQDLGPFGTVFKNLPIIKPLGAPFVNDFIIDLSRFEHNFIWPNSIQPTKIAWTYSVHVWKKMLLPFAKTNYTRVFGLRLHPIGENRTLGWIQQLKPNV